MLKKTARGRGLRTMSDLEGKGKVVALVDDKHLFPASNVIFVTTLKVAEEAGPAYEETIVEAQRGLTLPVMRELDARVEIQGKEPEAVAREYLRSVSSWRGVTPGCAGTKPPSVSSPRSRASSGEIRATASPRRYRRRCSSRSI
jgi:hypothetical protein